MSRVYTVTFEQVAVSAIQDLIQIVAPSDSVVVIHEWEFGQSSDAGDAESEQLNILVHRGSTDGSGGSAVTARPKQIGTPAFGGTCETNNTSQSTEGTIESSHCFNVMAGIKEVYTPETRPVLSPSGRMVWELQTAPADAITMSGKVTFEEIGG